MTLAKYNCATPSGSHKCIETCRSDYNIYIYIYIYIYIVKIKNILHIVG